MRYVGICKFATLHRTIPTSAWARCLGRSHGKAATPLVHLIQSRSVTGFVSGTADRLADRAVVDPEKATEAGVQDRGKGKKPNQMAKSKAKKKANAHSQPAASVPTGALVDGGTSKTKVAKLLKKQRKRAGAAAASAAMASQMQANSSTNPQGTSSQGSAVPEFDEDGFPVIPPFPFPGLNQPMGNYGTVGFNPLAPLFSPQPPQGSPRGPREENAHSHGGSHQAPISTRNDKRQKKGRQHQQKVVLAPSAESGGVPNPTPEYLMLASEVPFRLESPKPILIVLDLNGTLLHRPSKNPKAFVARPHALTFLNYLLSRFWVAVWSSAQPANVGAMIDNLIADKAQRDRLVAIWGRDRFGLSRHDYAQRVQVYKRLTRLWLDPQVAVSHPGFAQGERWDQSNTILVDDSVEKARSEPHNLVCVPEFVGNLRETPEVLPQVHDYLNELSFQTNVSSYMRATPFVMR
ncbi:hypothetical protein PspLS_05764 [Pyricularia sp. CBS 133598]|nr:hypothetical protein PspLS_05764 [Pyricularia sp. CBS 133598]